MLLHTTGVAESKYTDGLPWNSGIEVIRIRTGPWPTGIVGVQAPAWYENSVGEHSLHAVSL
jgi:hypothetical protein